MYQLEFENKLSADKNFDFSSELKKIADKIVIPLLIEGIHTNTDINGKRFPTLKPSTIKIKGHSRPLIDEAVLVNSFRSRPTNVNEVQVIIVGDRSQVGVYLQIVGIGIEKKRFNFFGLTKGMEKDAIELMSKSLKERLDG